MVSFYKSGNLANSERLVVYRGPKRLLAGGEIPLNNMSVGADTQRLSIYNERFETLRRRMILPFIDSLLFLLLRNNALKSFKNIFTFQVMQRNWQSLKRRYAVINR